MKSEGWIDVQIRTAVDAAELLGMLADPTNQGGWEDQGVVHLYWPKPQWNMEARARLNSILQEVDPGVPAESGIRVEELPDQDWNRQWVQSVRPIRIGRRIVIRPSWEPGRAAGTGH